MKIDMTNGIKMAQNTVFASLACDFQISNLGQASLNSNYFDMALAGSAAPTISISGRPSFLISSIQAQLFLMYQNRNYF